MKFKVTVIAILAAILAVNTAGILNIAENSQRQTEIALKTAELEAMQTYMQGTRTITDYTAPNGKVEKFCTANDANDSLERIDDICRSLSINAPPRSFGYDGTISMYGS